MSGDERQRKGRIKLLLIAAVSAFPFLLSYGLYFFWEPDARRNYGELITPVQFPEVARLRMADGTPARLADLRGKWVLISLDGAACGDACRQKLYFMRQVRKAQGKEMLRVERMWLIEDGGRPAADLAETFEGTWFVDAAGSDLARLLPAQGSPREHIYLMDPLGNVMLRFPREPDPTGMRKDLSRLLRASRVG